jgi:hypothetical protein
MPHIKIMKFCQNHWYTIPAHPDPPRPTYTGSRYSVSDYFALRCASLVPITLKPALRIRIRMDHINLGSRICLKMKN